MARNGAAGGAVFSVGNRAYPIIDHTFDVVVVGAGGAGSGRHSEQRRPG